MGRGASEFDPLSIQRTGLDSYEPAQNLPSPSLLRGLTYIAAGGDWAGLYRDGVLVEQGHMQENPSDLLAIAGIEVKLGEPDPKWLSTAGTLPAGLQDAKLTDTDGMTLLEASATNIALNTYADTRFVLIEGNGADWFGLYDKGTCLVQGHLRDLDMPQLLALMGIEIKAKSVDLRPDVSVLPQQLADLPEHVSNIY